MTRKILNTVLTVGTIVAGITIATPAKANDNYCRDFNQKIRINGELEQAYGRACLQPNGTWKIVSTNSDDDNHKTSHYKIKKTYTHASPLRTIIYWNNGPYYHGHGKHYKKHYRHKRHSYYRGHKKRHNKRR